jgi:hypothetical protein
VISFAGSKGSLKLFVDSDSAVVVDTSVNMIVGSGDASAVFASYEWDEPTGSVETSVLELASSALTTLDINVITASGRMYTIPDGVKSEAKKALEWRKEEKRGGTPVGLNTARTLAKGGQIGIEKIRHIAKYFPRHEVDKKGKGWKPGTDNFPSNGRIAWALWGGDAAWRWASAIVERENKKSLRAGGYATPGYDRSVDIYNTPYTYGSDMDSFKAAYELDPTSGPEFMTRVRLDGSGFDRLYKIETDGRVCVWDDGRWDDLGHVDGDVWSYDSALDDEYDDCEKDHVIVDPQTAMLMSAMWQDDPYRFISIDDIDPEEASLVREAYPQEDWKVVDYVITAAVEQKPSGAINPDDNVDTPAEKSMRSASQQRDATGKFAQAGGRVVVGGDTTNGRGTLLNIGPSGMGKVQLDNGRTVDVPVKLTKPESEVEAAPVAPNPAVGKPLDVDGILGEPRTPKNMPGAQLPGTYPPMGASDLKAVVNDWGNWVNEQRAAFKPVDGESAPASQKIATVKDGKIVTQKLSPTAADKANAGKPVINPAAQTAKAEARRDSATAGRTPAPAPRPGTQGPTPRAADRANQGKPVINTGAQTAKIEARRDGAASGRAPAVPTAPTPKPAVPAAEARKDKAAAGRGPAPAPKPNPNVGPGKIPAAPAPKPAVPTSEVRRDKAAAGRGPVPAPSNQDALRQDRNADRKAAAPKADPGTHIVEKGDSLWSIAEKNKPAGKSTAEYWAEVMKANPKGNFKSGNPSLIYSGEKVNLPGKKPAAPIDPKAQAAKTEARRDKATAGRAPASTPKPGTQGPSPRAADKANEGKTVINTGARTAKAEARRDKATSGRESTPKPAGTQGPSPRAADKANEGKTVINTGAQTAKTEAKRDRTSAGRAPAPKPAPATTTPRAADKANEGRPVINTGAQTAKTEAKRDRNRGTAGTRKRK